MSKLKKIFIVVLIASLFTTSFYAQKSENDSTQIETESIYFESKALFKYLVKLPNNYNPKKSSPLIVGLYGGNQTAKKFIKIWDEIKEPQFIYAVPQAPYAWFMNGKFGFDWSLWPTGNDELIERAAIISENYIIDLIKELTNKYNVSNVYLFGFSQGAIFAYRVGIKNHQYVDGLICLSGPGLLEKIWSPFSDTLQVNWLPEKYIKAGNDLRVFISNGDTDKFTPIELGIKSRDILKKYGYDVIFQDFNGGHEVNYEILDNVIEWIKQ